MILPESAAWMGVPAEMAISRPLWLRVKYCVMVPLTGHIILPVATRGELFAFAGAGLLGGAGLTGGAGLLGGLLGGAGAGLAALLSLLGGSGRCGWRSGGRITPRALGWSRG